MTSQNQLYKFTITPKTPILMHADDIEAADRLQIWRKDPKNKNKGVKGDDRSPPWTWMTGVYTNGECIAIPRDCLQASLAQGAALVEIPNSKRGKTYKELIHTALSIVEDFLPLFVDGKTIPKTAIDELIGLTFAEQAAAVKQLGFSLFVKRARIGTSKHVRVRAKFDNYHCGGTFKVLKDELIEERLRMICAHAGDKGILDGRPGAPSRPWPFGVYNIELEKL
jgi:hypothetical protein